MATGGADILANELAESLLNGEKFDIEVPNFEDGQYELPAPTTGGLYGPIAQISNDDLTTRSLTGSGTFDALMQAFKVHLKEEFDRGRITGEQYTKAYVSLVEGAMANATQFLLGKDASYWNAIGAQLQARRAEVEVVTARVMLEAEKTKLQTLRYEALTAQSAYALNKLRLATESIGYDTAKFNLAELLPLQKQQASEEVNGIKARTAMTVEQTKGVVNDNDLHLLRKQQLEKQIAALIAETTNVGKQGLLLDNEAALQPQKVDMLAKQILGVIGQNTLLNKQALQLDNDLALAPLRKQQLEKQIAELIAQTTNTTKQGTILDKEIELAPAKAEMLAKQILGVVAQSAYVGKQGEVIEKELELQPFKKTLMQEQAEAQRAQTLDTRTDGTAVTGTVGKQKQLYAQQIISYQRDAEMKAAKVFTDAWITMKTMDEGLAPPTLFSNANLDTILTKVKTNNGL